MNIKNITLVDGIITITLDTAASVKKVYIDNLYNSKNKYSNVDEEHTYVIVDPTVTNNTILIDSKSFTPELDSSAFTVLINGTLGFYYDDKEIYYKEVNLLTSYCNTCLDKLLKERMTLFVLKSLLLDYAMVNNMVEDQIEYYRDLARMLNIDLLSNVHGMCSGNCQRVSNCCNGCCSLC